MNQFDNYLDSIQLKEACKAIMDNFEAQVEFYRVSAKIQKAFYDELINAGFNEQQALEIVKYQGIAGGGSQSTQ